MPAQPWTGVDYVEAGAGPLVVLIHCSMSGADAGIHWESARVPEGGHMAPITPALLFTPLIAAFLERP